MPMHCRDFVVALTCFTKGFFNSFCKGPFQKTRKHMTTQVCCLACCHDNHMLQLQIVFVRAALANQCSSELIMAHKPAVYAYMGGIYMDHEAPVENYSLTPSVIKLKRQKRQTCPSNVEKVTITAQNVIHNAKRRHY